MLAPKNHKNPQDAPKTLPGYSQDALRRPKKAQDGPKRQNVDFTLVLKGFLGDQVCPKSKIADFSLVLEGFLGYQGPKNAKILKSIGF